MAVTAPQRHVKTESEVVNVAIDMRGLLDEGELLTGTPTVEEVDTTDLTIASQAISVATLLINGESVAAGQAVQFSVAAGEPDTDYTIRITVTTTSTPAQTRIVRARLRVIPD